MRPKFSEGKLKRAAKDVLNFVSSSHETSFVMTTGIQLPASRLPLSNNIPLPGLHWDVKVLQRQRAEGFSTPLKRKTKVCPGLIAATLWYQALRDKPTTVG